MKSLPLQLTLFRIILTFPVVYLLQYDQHQNTVMNTVAVVLFIIASITDYYDGYFARKLNAVTQLGKFLDPVADKILITSVLIVLVRYHIVDIWMVMLFVARDTLVGGIRAAASAEGLIIPAQATGKWKAALQMIAVPLLMIQDLHEQIPSQKIGYGLLWVSVLLSLISGWDYFKLYRSARTQTP